MTTTAYTATKTTKTSRDGKTVTRIVTVRDAAGNETGRRTSKTSDYAALRIDTADGGIISAHKTEAAAYKAHMAGEYGFNASNAAVVLVEEAA